MSELYRIYSGMVFNKYPLQIATFRFDRLTNLERGVGPASPANKWPDPSPADHKTEAHGIRE